MPEISFKRFTGRHFLLLCFWLGMAGASVVVWWRGAEILSYKNTWPDTASFAGAFFAVIKQRFFQLGAGWLCSLTVYSFWLFWDFYMLLVFLPWNGDRQFYGRKRFFRSAYLFTVCFASGNLLSGSLVCSFMLVCKQTKTAAAAGSYFLNAAYSLWSCCGGIFLLIFFNLKRRIHKNYLKMQENQLYCKNGVKAEREQLQGYGVFGYRKRKTALCTGGTR